MNSYRFDYRSEEQFVRDIKSRTLEERALFECWLDLIEKETGNRPAFKDTGCGKDGNLLQDNEVSTDPDFDVNGFGLVEVKFSKPKIKDNFHLKVSQVKQYLKKNVTILMVNGSDTTPEFTMLKADALKNISKFCEKVCFGGFGGKLSYRIPIGMFIWRQLK